MVTLTLVRSTLLLDTTTSDADTTANNLTRQHSLVMSGFPTVRGVPARQALGVLYHIRPTLPQQVALLVQSSDTPDWSRLPSFVAETQVEHFEQTIDAGQLWNFACDANPSFRPSGRERQFLHSPSDQHAWWEHRSQIHGFRTQKLILQGLGTRRGDQGLALSVVRFSGQLVVEDPQRFAESFRHGVGPGKAFGCGLLSLAG